MMPGCCLVKLQNYTFSISILNVTEEEKIIQVPQVILKDIDMEEHVTQKSVNAMQTRSKNTNIIFREERIQNSLRTEHLNQKEPKSLLELCREYNDVFHLEGNTLTHA
ncbi:hypothetical protein P5V15_011389 [Pogonomyrmex californicus]